MQTSLSSLFHLFISLSSFVECHKLKEETIRLYVEKIDLGEESGPRTVVSGLRQFATLEEMQVSLSFPLVLLSFFEPRER